VSFWEQFRDAVTSEFADMGDAEAAVRVSLRLLLAGILGGLLGLERETTGKSAGIRTHALVALGAALFMLAPIEAGADELAQSRLIQGLVAGIGFLGAGAIVKGHVDEDIRGLTTAAGIWMTAAIGMAAAMGRGVTAIIATVLALIVLRILPGGGPDNNARPPEIKA
jgi:putative Mg2+ transporter-C (MgtC) family protein